MSNDTITNYSDYYDEYCNTYQEYKNGKRRLAGFTESLRTRKEEKRNLENNKTTTEKALKWKESEYQRTHTILLQGEESYRQNSVRRDKEIAAKIASYKKELEEKSKMPELQFGKYTSGTAYEKDVNLINSKYDAQQQAYKSKRQASLLGELDELNKKKEAFQSNPDEITMKKIESLDGYGKVYVKVASIDNYLDSPKVRRNSIAKEIKSDIATRNFIPGDCGDSVSALKAKVLNLIDVTKLPRDNVKDPEEAKRYLSENPSMMIWLISICATLALLAGFVMVFPLDDVLPHVIDTSGWWWIFGWLAWLLNSARFLILWAIQLILCFIIWFVTFELLASTSLAVLFYHPQSQVEKGLVVFKKEYDANKGTFALLYNFNKAARVALGKELDKNINDCTYALAHITEENEYKNLEALRKNELYLLNAEKTKQLKERYDQINRAEEQARERDKTNSLMVRQKEQELNQEEERRLTALNKAYKHLYDADRNAQSELERCKKELDNYINSLGRCNKEIQETENHKKQDEITCKKQYESLQKKTEEIRSSKFFEESATSMFSPECIEAVNGNLSKNLYFVARDLDEEKLAVVHRVNSACRPILCLYKRSELSSANLCNELAGFIKWYGETLERVNPLPLIDGKRFSVIDTSTGAALFQDNKDYFDFRVVSNNEEIKAYTERLKAQIDLIRSAAAELKTDMNIGAVNRKKAEINRHSIPHATRLDVMQEQYCPYCVSFFIMPAEVQGHIHDNTGLTEELQQYYHNCEIYGFMPIFLIDNETWENKNPSPSVEYLKNVVSTKDYRYISGVGTRAGSELKISLTPYMSD